jgi:hypothetical protein
VKEVVRLLKWPPKSNDFILDQGGNSRGTKKWLYSSRIDSIVYLLEGIVVRKINNWILA